MLSLDAVAFWLKWLAVPGYALLLARIIADRLYGIYPCFTAFLGFRLLTILAFRFIPPRTDLYAEVYFATEFLGWLLLLLVILELYRLVFQGHQGVAATGRKLMLGAAGLAALIAAASSLIDLQEGVSKFPILMEFYLLGRLVMSALAIFILLLAGVMSYYPIPLTRNVIVHVWTFAAYFFGRAAIFLFLNVLADNARDVLNAVMHFVVLLSLTAWLAMFNRSGERHRVKSSHRWNAEDEERVMAQLAAINATLLRTAQK